MVFPYDEQLNLFSHRVKRVDQLGPVCACGYRGEGEILERHFQKWSPENVPHIERFILPDDNFPF
jgi:hypothetical protein